MPPSQKSEAPEVAASEASEPTNQLATERGSSNTMIPQSPDPDQTPRYDAHCAPCGEYLKLPGGETDHDDFQEWVEAHENCGAGNHGCRFDWCINGRETIGVDLEHMSNVEAIPAIGMPPGGKQGEILVSLWFQEDLELAPTIQITASDGDGERAADLRIQEAAILHDRLGRLIQKAIAGTNFNPHRIIEYLGDRG